MENRKILEKSILNKIERLEIFEEKMKVRFENISVKIQFEGEFLDLFFEVHPLIGTEILESTIIECVLYNKGGSIIDTYNRTIYPEDFFGFELMKFSFSDNYDFVSSIGKIRLYPKKR